MTTVLQLKTLSAEELSTIGPVVGYRDAQGRSILSSWSGRTKVVWAKFNDGELPPLTLMRDEMIAVYEPQDAPIPAYLVECICFVVDPSMPCSPRKTEMVPNPVCEGCQEFKVYRKDEVRNERNCLNWLCAGGYGCPHRAVIASGKG